MDLKDLQKNWDQYSSRVDKSKLDEETIRGMLRNHKKSLIEKIDRNIWMGISIVFVIVLFIVLGDYIILSQFINVSPLNVEIPIWPTYLYTLTNFVIITTFICYVYQYCQVKKKSSVVQDLKDTLTKIIHVLILYRRLLYFALIVLLLAIASAFMTGMNLLKAYSSNQNSNPGNEIELKNMIFKIIIGLIALLILSAGILELSKWRFNRLYGNYLNKLKQTLSDLNEIT
jgi:hypothetical protein